MSDQQEQLFSGDDSQLNDYAPTTPRMDRIEAAWRCLCGRVVDEACNDMLMNGEKAHIHRLSAEIFLWSESAEYWAKAARVDISRIRRWLYNNGYLPPDADFSPEVLLTEMTA